MTKLLIFTGLFLLYIVYGFVVYTRGTRTAVHLSPHEDSLSDRGKLIFQEKNCIACHQLYGLGGYLGPELTTAWSDPQRGEVFMKAFLKGGGPRMPNFHFSETEISALMQFLKYVDSTATSYKTRRP